LVEAVLLVLETALILSSYPLDFLNDDGMPFFGLGELSSGLFELLPELPELFASILELIFVIFALSFEVNIIVFDNLKLLFEELFVYVQLFLKFSSGSFTVLRATNLRVLFSKSRMNDIFLLKFVSF
jgi:hypothetical protein